MLGWNVLFMMSIPEFDGQLFSATLGIKGRQKKRRDSIESSGQRQRKFGIYAKPLTENNRQIIKSLSTGFTHVISIQLSLKGWV